MRGASPPLPGAGLGSAPFTLSLFGVSCSGCCSQVALGVFGASVDAAVVVVVAEVELAAGWYPAGAAPAVDVAEVDLAAPMRAEVAVLWRGVLACSCDSGWRRLVSGAPPMHHVAAAVSARCCRW